MKNTPVSPDSVPLDLSPNMNECPGQGTSILRPLKIDPDPDPERSADREAVALAMVTDLTKATGVPPMVQVLSSVEVEVGDTDLSAQPRRKQRKRPREDEKICLVCGDKALAHNFDAITCESCKAFFRRNALRLERIACLFIGECPITVPTRRFCPSCRLQKCFSVGMKADLILDEVERKARMEKVTENRVKRQTLHGAADTESSGDSQVGSSSQACASVSSNMADSSGLGVSSASTNLPTSTVTTASLLISKLQERADEAHHRSQQQQQQMCRGSVLEKGGVANLHYVLKSGPNVSAASTDFQPVLTVPAAGQPPRHAPSAHSHNSTNVNSGSIQHQLQQKIHSQHQQQQQFPVHTQVLSQQLHRPPQLPQPQPQPLPQLQPQPPQQPQARMSLGGSHLAGPSSAGPVPAQQDFQHVSRDLLPSDPHMYWRLSEEEKTQLTHLSSVYQDTIMVLPERVPCDGKSLLQKCKQFGEPESIRFTESLFETSEKNTRQLIKFVQQLSDFNQLREDDKIAILQASGLRSVIFRWTALFVVERNSWLTRYGESDMATMTTIFGHEDIVCEIANFCRSTKTILKNDVTLFALMHCLVLFDPREPNLVDRQLINTFRDRYVILLKHYLESEYSFAYTERYLRAIMDKTAEIRNVAEKSMGILRDFFEYVPPLMKQVLNLEDPS